MNAHQPHRPLTPASLTLALALSLVSAGSLAGPGTQTEDDIYVGNKRQVQGATSPTVATPKPLLPGGTATAPSTGLSRMPVSTTPAKTPVQGVPTPGTAAPQPRPGAGVSPNTGASAKKKTALSGGDDDLDDLEVERRKVQGVNTPGTTTPQLRPGAGTSPNTGRSVMPGPAPLPGK